MQASYQNLIERLDESLAQLIWDQWFDIGGSGSTQKRGIPFVIDIEALILGSTRFGRKDPRIFEQCIDWLAHNGDLVSLQRLKNMQQSQRFGDESTLRHLADFMISEKHLNWKSIMTSFPEKSAKVAENSAFYVARGMSRSPLPTKPQSLLFRLRHFCGMSARADIFCWLLTHPEGHAAQIAQETQWMPKTVQLVLIELERSRLIACVTKGRQKRYRLNPLDWTVFEPDGGNACWFNSALFFKGCFEVLSLLESLVQLENKVVALQSMEIARAMPALAKTFFGLTPAESFQMWERELRGQTLVDYFRTECEMLSLSINERLFYRTESFPRVKPIELAG